MKNTNVNSNRPETNQSQVWVPIALFGLMVMSAMAGTVGNCDIKPDYNRDEIVCHEDGDCKKSALTDVSCVYTQYDQLLSIDCGNHDVNNSSGPMLTNVKANAYTNGRCNNGLCDNVNKGPDGTASGIEKIQVSCGT